MDKPLAIDLFCGLGGWTEGLLAEGYDVIGFDIEAHAYGEERYPGKLVMQDVLTLHGSQFKDAALIVASPPCQEYSYMAMPWGRAKAKAAAIRADATGAELDRLNRLFNACFRIQREACEAAGRHIPMVVENVRGAQPWVGRAAWNFGSYYLWGDLPALMPAARARKTFRHPNIRDGHAHTKHLTNRGEHCICPTDCDCERVDGGLISNECPIHNHDPYPVEGCSVHDPEPAEDGRKNPGFRFDGSGRSFQSESVNRHAHEGVKQPGLSGMRNNGKGDKWFQDGAARSGSKSSARKAASAKIAKIPFALSSWIARTYKPAPAALQLKQEVRAA